MGAGCWIERRSALVRVMTGDSGGEERVRSMEVYHKITKDTFAPVDNQSIVESGISQFSLTLKEEG